MSRVLAILGWDSFLLLTFNTSKTKLQIYNYENGIHVTTGL